MLTFKDFEKQVISTNHGVFKLNETVAHIEDLPPQEFLRCIRNIANLIASEKLDGANMIVGVDNSGRLYVSREFKGGGRIYKNTAPTRAAENGFCAAFTALKQVEPIIRHVIKDGEAIECELLFGRQPNAIVYGDNYIAFLRTIPGDNGEHPDQSKVKALTDALKGERVRIEISLISTIDGSKLITRDEAIHFKFTSTTFIDSHHFKTVDVDKELEHFEKWLRDNPLSSFKSKNALADAASKFMLPIKEKLLDQLVRYRIPALRTQQVSDDENIGVEGIVIHDPQTGKQVKLVDKDAFTIINRFNHSIRNEIKQTSHTNKETQKAFSASVGHADQSIYDKMLTGIAKAIGIPSLDKYTRITHALRSFKTVPNFIRAWPQDVPAVKTSVGNCVDTAIEDLQAARRHFLENWKSYNVKLKDGRLVKYTDEVYKRTLIVFAETLHELTDIRQNISKSASITEIASAVFGKQLKAIGNQ